MNLSQQQVGIAGTEGVPVKGEVAVGTMAVAGEALDLGGPGIPAGQEAVHEDDGRAGVVTVEVQAAGLRCLQGRSQKEEEQRNGQEGAMWMHKRWLNRGKI
jgi:hypothetical protein